MKVVVACLFLFLTSIAFTQEIVDYKETTKEAVAEMQKLVKGDLDLKVKVEKVYHEMEVNGKIMLSTKQYQPILSLRQEIINTTVFDESYARKKERLAILNEKYYLITNLLKYY